MSGVKKVRCIVCGRHLKPHRGVDTGEGIVHYGFFDKCYTQWFGRKLAEQIREINDDRFAYGSHREEAVE